MTVKKTVNKKAETKIEAGSIKAPRLSSVKEVGKVTGIHKAHARKASRETAVVQGKIKIDVIGLDGVVKGSIFLPVEIFGQTPNKNLIAQAVRVYLANQRQGTASTKTRANVTGSTRKIYRQKGTGRARHGAITGPIFVGGGIVFGPHMRDFSLKFPKKMRQAALIGALSEKAQQGLVKAIDGDFGGKTKEVAHLMKLLNVTKKGKPDKVLFVVDTKSNAARAAKNIGGLEVESSATLTTYGVVVSKHIIFSKNAVEDLKKRFISEN